MKIFCYARALVRTPFRKTCIYNFNSKNYFFYPKASIITNSVNFKCVKMEPGFLDLYCEYEENDEEPPRNK